MNYDEFDNEAEDTTDADYFAFIAWLSEQTSAELRNAKGDTEAEKQALCRYWARGNRANLTPGELLDFLCVDTPCILDAAGYSEAEGDALMSLSDSLTLDESLLEDTLPLLPKPE